MSYKLGRDQIFWRIGVEKSSKIVEDVKNLEDVEFVDDNGRTYLHVACSSHNIEVAKVLLQRGINPNVRDKEGHSPILSAIGQLNSTNPEFLKNFLQYGLDLNEDVNGMTLRETIESFRDEELMKIIEDFEKSN